MRFRPASVWHLERLVIHASSSALVPLPKTGFQLEESQGDTLTLTRSVAAGGGIADSVAFGNQLSDHSIGRRPLDGASGSLPADLWRGERHRHPGRSAGSAHQRVARPCRGSQHDRFHAGAFNPGALPVNIGGAYLTDNPVEWPNRHPIRQLTYVGAGGYALFKADGDTNQGPDHLSFGLSPSQGEIGLFGSDLALINSVVYGPQATDISQGRSPNGDGVVTFFTQPSPGGPNPGTTIATDTTTVNLIPVVSTWKYRSSATDLSGTYGGRV